MNAEGKLVCAHCQHANRQCEMICAKCQRPLSRQLEQHTRTIKVDALEMEPVAPSGTRLIAEKDPIILHIEGVLVPLRLQARDQTVLGRLNPRNPRRPDLDLTPFGGFEKGISTTHAVLMRQDNQAIISDLGSTNGTFVNGTRLEPHTRQVLHSGDELRLGNMIIKVHFGAAIV
jgi:hypothetical protein